MSPVLVIATGTVTGQVVNSLGQPLAGIPVVAKLNAGVSTPQTISPVGQVVPVEVAGFTDSTGAWSLSLVPNNNINPSNTTYTIQIQGMPDVVVQLNDTASHLYTTIAVNPTTAILSPAGQTVAQLTVTGELDVTGGAVFHGPGPWFDITHPSFGGKADGVTDNSPALAAILAVAPAGSTIFLPTAASAYVFASAFPLTNKSMIRIKGGGPVISGGASGGAQVKFTTTSGPLIAASGTTGVELEDLQVQWPNTFTGTVVDSSGSTFDRIARCFFQATGGGANAAVIVGLDNTTRCVIERSAFHNAAVGIQGLGTAGHFSIGITVCECNFSSSTGDIAAAHISNPHQDWVMQGNVHEMGQGAGNCVAVSTPLSAGNGVYFMGNWLGDQGANAVNQVSIGTGWAVIGNYFGGAAAVTAISVPNNASGIDIAGNEFATYSVAVAVGTSVSNIRIGPNDRQSVTTYVTGTPSSGGLLLTNGTTVLYGASQVQGQFSLTKDFVRSRQTPSEATLVAGVDASAAEHVSVTITAARLVGAPANPASGDHLIFTFTQGGAGGFAITWNAVFKVTWADAGNGAGKISTVEFWYNGTNWCQVGAQAPYV